MGLKHDAAWDRILRALQAAGAVLALVAGVFLIWAPASATAPVAQSAVIDATNGGNVTVTSNTPFTSGQKIAVTVPANTTNGGDGPLASDVNYTVWECSDPGATAANLPTDISSCDSDTSEGTNGLTGDDGSVDASNYEVYNLPNTVLSIKGGLGEGATHTPICNLSNPCVIAVITNPENFTDPTGIAFSEPFYISPNSTNSGTPAGDGSAPPVGATPSASASTVTASTASVPADGQNGSTITVTLQSSTDVPVSGKTVSLSASGGSSTINPASGITDASGQVEFGVSDTVAEGVTYAAQDTSDSITVTQTATVQFTTPTVDTSASSVDASPIAVASDGSTPSTITVTLNDAGATPVGVPGKTVTLTAASGQSTITPSSGTATTNASGVATFTVVDSTAEQVIYSAEDTTDSISIGKATVTFGTVSVSATASTVLPEGTSGACGGSTFCEEVNVPLTVTVTLLASDGVSPVAGKTVTLSASTSTQPSPSSVVTGSNGEATFTFTDANPGTVTFNAVDTSDGGSGGLTVGKPLQVLFAAAAASASTSTVVAPTNSAPADGSTTLEVQVTVKDQFGNGLSGKVVTLSGNAGTSPTIGATGATGTTPAGTTNSSGEALFDVRDETAEAVNFSAIDTSDGGASGLAITQTAQVTFTPGTPDPNTSTMSVDNAKVALGSPAHVTVTLKDHYASGVGNPVPGKVVSLSASGGTSAISPAQATTDSGGQAVFAVTDSTAEVVTYSATDVTDNNLQIGAQVSVTFGTPPPPPAAVADSVVLASSTSEPADGKTSATIDVLLSDANGDPIAGKAVALSASGGHSSIVNVSATTSQAGEATFNVTDSTPESVSFTATDTTDNESITGQSVTIEFTTASGSTTSSTTTTTTSSSTTSTTTTPTSSTTTSTTTASAASTASSSSGGSADGSTGSSDASASTGSSGSSGSLAFTGPPSALPWLLGFGLFLALVGSVGRRLRMSQSQGE